MQYYIWTLLLTATLTFAVALAAPHHQQSITIDPEDTVKNDPGEKEMHLIKEDNLPGKYISDCGK